MRTRFTLFVAALASLCWVGVVHAQATRTWVSGVGDDANPCARTAPCKTFAGAFAKTAAAGEIDALDPGEFGALTITKAITIDGHQSLGAAMTVGSTGIAIAAGATDTVTLRGLTVHGDGTKSGILFSSGAALHVEDCAIERFKEGVDIEPTLGGRVFLLRVRSRNNGDAGVLVRSGAPSLVTVVGAHLQNNGVGLLAGAGARVSVLDSVASGNSGPGVSAALDGAGGVAEINLQGVSVNQNGIGVNAAATAGSALVRMSQVLGTGNLGGATVETGTGSIQSFGDNRLDVKPGLTLSSSAPSQQVMSGKPATFPVAVAVTGLLANPISFACTGLRGGAACHFAPATLDAGSAGGMVTVTVTTSLTMMGQNGAWPRVRVPPAALAFFFALLAALSFSRSREDFGGSLRRPLKGAAALVLLLSLGYLGCNGPTGGPDGPDMTGTADMQTGVSPGSYPFQVVATSGALNASLPLTLIVN